MTAELLKFEEKTWDHITQQALEVYGIERHFSSDAFPELVDGDPLRDAFKVVARAAVAVVLSKLGSGEVLRMHDNVHDWFTEAAVDMDLQTIEIEDGA